MWLLNVLLLFIVAVGSTHTISNNDAPYFDLDHRKTTVYHGLIRENETLVKVNPEIRAIYPNHPFGICGFRIVGGKHFKAGDIPFKIKLREMVAGEQMARAQLLARHKLNCEKRDTYKFDIIAVGCNDSVHSHSATVHISVEDVNEFEPIFTKPSYACQIAENRNYTEIVRVEASDPDCSPKFGDICKYELLATKDKQPFSIDSNGVIHNVEPLSYAQSHIHNLSVVAFDCGMRQSDPVTVTVNVCQLGWRHLPKRIDYVPATGRQELLNAVELDLCDVQCQKIREYRAVIHLDTKHIGKGCDRDTYSVESQRKLCGAAPHATDLLPAPGVDTPWTRNLRYDEGRQSDLMFEFNDEAADENSQSAAAATIPANILTHKFPTQFTISTWLLHARHQDKDKHSKEHIMCLADDHRMNRHHLALFLRNCRLILLWRREATDGNANMFKPAEWRWSLTQVCDNQWHHYAISVDFPNVELYVDGQLEKRTAEVIDDWQLHPAKGINTTLMVGACWQSSENRTKHALKGFLSGLSVLLGANERPSVLNCLYQCKENLQPPAMELLQPGMEVLTNSDLSEVTVEGPNKTNLELLVRKVAYTNWREYPTPGHRNLQISTTVTCDSDEQIELPNSANLSLMVLPALIPTIHLSGTQNMSRNVEDFRQGVRIFADIHISGGGGGGTTTTRKLDKCTVTVTPPLAIDREEITLAKHLLKDFGLAASISQYGAVITGTDMVLNYQEVLRHMDYINMNPTMYKSRIFKLSCSELNDRFISNEYLQTLIVNHHRRAQTVITHEQRKDPQVAHATVHKHSVEILATVYHSAPERHHFSSLMATGIGGSHVVTIIVVICVGFLLFMLVLGVVRIRHAHLYRDGANHRRGPITTSTIVSGIRRQKAAPSSSGNDEMTWDDSALTITVNPLEDLEGKLDESCNSETCPIPESSDDDLNDDDDEEEEEIPSIFRRKSDYQNVSQLEWDHSNI